MLNINIKKVNIKNDFEIINNRLYFKNINYTSQHYKNKLNLIFEELNIPYKAKVRNGIIVLCSNIGLKQIKFYNIAYYDFNYCKFELNKI